MIQERLDIITKADIESLIEDKVSESRTLEYKRQLPANTDDAKKKFLAEVTAFANTIGGDIIIGIAEDDGIASEVVPIDVDSADSVILRIGEMVRNNIDPKLPIQMRAIPGWGDDDAGYVLVLRIPQSTASPHMITLGKTRRFFKRNDAGKFPLDVREIREAFLASESQGERLRTFVSERVGKILTGETPVPLSTHSHLILHIIPIDSFLRRERLQLQDHQGDIEGHFWPYGSPTGMSTKYSLDGLVTFTAGKDDREPTYTYTQVFFNGSVETVYGDIVFNQDSETVELGFSPDTFLKHIKKVLAGLQKLDLAPPLAVFITLHGVKGARMYRQTRWPSDREYLIDRSTLMLPETIIASYEEDIKAMLRPLFDALWNAAGYARSPYYDEAGNWIHKR